MKQLGRPPVKRVEIACSGCATPVFKRESDLKRKKSQRTFCTIECARRTGTKPRKAVDVTCEQCQTSFYPVSGAVNRFCGKICYDAWQARRATRTDCEQCGTSFANAPSKNARFCSWPCYRAYDEVNATKAFRLVNTDGYVLLYMPEHPEVQPSTGYAFEHRVVMAEAIGHALPKGSTVHHRNGIHDDNRLSNLELWASTHRPGQRVLELLDYAREILALFGPDEETLRALEQ